MTGKIIVPLLFSAAVILGGCNFLQKQAGDVATQQISQAMISELLKDIEDPLIRQHLTAQFQVKSYRTITDSSGRGQTSTTDVVVEGDSAKFRTAISEQGKPVSDMIMIGDTTYVKDLKDNSWWMQTVKPDESTMPTGVDVPTADDFAEKFEENKSTVKYTSLGTEACGSLTCHKYREETEGQEGGRVFWFDNQKFLLRKDEFAFGEFTSTNTYVYDNITVTTPSPTKQVPEGRNIYEYLMGDTGVGAMPAGFDPSQYAVPEGVPEDYMNSFGADGVEE